MLPSIKVRSSDIHANVAFFFVAGKFDRELNLPLWQSGLKPSN